MTSSVRRTRIDHRAAAARLRSHPGEWLPVGEYRTRASADSIAAAIRTGRWSANQTSAYTTGGFEARTEMTEFGVRVVARYLGGESR